jgi:hypothetical protein
VHIGLRWVRTCCGIDRDSYPMDREVLVGVKRSEAHCSLSSGSEVLKA